MENFDLFYDYLKRLIACKSVQGDPAFGAPFGVEVKKAYDVFIECAEKLGFTVSDYDGYMGEIRYGSGEEIGIIGHLDVVPAGDGWESDPFTLTEKDGYLCGRGMSDDKAPLLLCLFALNELKKSGIKCNKTFRMFFGTNEETGWKDVEYFKGINDFPEYGFSPDGDFPVSYAEKGIAIVEFRLPKLRLIDTVSGGTVINAVCAHALCSLKNADGIIPIANKFGLTVNGKTVESFGVSAHGSHPELGVNAIKNLLLFLRDAGEELGDLPEYLFDDKSGLCKLSSSQGNVTLSPDLIGKDENGVYIKCDCRFPYPFTEKDLLPYFEKFGVPFNLTVKHGTQYVEKEGKLVDTLLSAYNGATGENLAPISQGGSTFARVFKKGVAFGPEFPGINSHMHEANERVSVKALEKTYEIYKNAIFCLAKIKNPLNC